VDFKASYSILDAGINAKGGGHDDFAAKISDVAYPKMAEAVTDYLRQHVTPKTV